MRFIFITLIIQITLCFFQTYTFAQEADSIVVYDTVTLEKPPLIITKTITLPPLKTRNHSKFLLSVLGGLSYYISYNNVCKKCEDFYAVTKKTNKAALSYFSGLEVIYMPNKIFISGKVLYSPYKEKFHFIDSSNTEFSSTNKVSYIESFLGGGMAFGNEESIVRLLVSAEVKLSFLNRVKGYIPDSSSYQSAVLLQEVHHYRNTVPGLAISAKLLTRLFHNTYLMPELGYSYDLQSIVETSGPYTIQRHIPSLRLAMIKGL